MTQAKGALMPYKVTYKFMAGLNLAVLGAGALVCAFINISVAYGFVIGYIIGVLNAAWLRRTAKKSAALPPAKAGRRVAINYYLRFGLTAVVFTALIYHRLLNPWSPLAGLIASIFTWLIITILSAREEALE